MIAVIADTVANHGGRITTLKCTYPRYIHAQVMTHRVFSRNAASSRAIPTSVMIENARVMPNHFGLNQAGMQPQKVEADRERCEAVWNIARENAITSAINLQALGVHKEVVNRLLEPFMFITTLITSTEWDNFFKQRLAHDAQSEIRLLAEEMCEAIRTSVPAQRMWHLPFAIGNNVRIEQSVARCARVSYNKEGRESTLDEDIALYEKLKADGHWSPFEHVAHAGVAGVKSGNFTGWVQHRQEVQR